MRAPARGIRVPSPLLPGAAAAHRTHPRPSSRHRLRAPCAPPVLLLGTAGAHRAHTIPSPGASPASASGHPRAPPGVPPQTPRVPPLSVFPLIPSFSTPLHLSKIQKWPLPKNGERPYSNIAVRVRICTSHGATRQFVCSCHALAIRASASTYSATAPNVHFSHVPLFAHGSLSFTTSVSTSSNSAMV